MNPDYIDNWPPQSPHLDPIGNGWMILKQRVKRRKSTSKEELKDFLLEKRDLITYDEINDLILGERRGMSVRMQQCYERQGLQTQF